MIRVSLLSATTVRCRGVTVEHRTPLLAMARLLIGGGEPPDELLVATWGDGRSSMRGRLGAFARPTVSGGERGMAWQLYAPHPKDQRTRPPEAFAPLPATPLPAGSPDALQRAATRPETPCPDRDGG